MASPHEPAPLVPPAEERSTLETAARVALLFLLLFGFLVAIETMSKAIKGLTDAGMLGGGGEDAELFGGVANPFAGLALGVLFTVLVQSSSTTTSTIVAVVGSGVLSVEHAVPMILGANVGTTVTNTLVSIGHVTRRRDFYRAFAAATVHDFFNLMMVAVVLPIEMATGFLARSASALTRGLGETGGGEYASPIKTSVKAGHGWLTSAAEGLGLAGGALHWMLLVCGVLLTFLCLVRITKNMRRLMAGRIERTINRALGASTSFGLVVGILLTMAVQSSSVTTSLLVPMCAAGIMRLRNAFPIMLGANIGTTLTALLASLSQEGPEALTIALVHVIFNVLGVAVCMLAPGVQRVPIRAAQWLAGRALRSKLWVVGYVAGVFVVVPVVGWSIWQSAAS